MIKSKKILSIFLCLVCLMLMTACWDHVEMNKLLIVAGIGLDSDGPGGLYRATLEFIDIEKDNAESKIIEGEGETAYSAMQNAMTLAGGAMFANHCKVMVFGEELARQGIDDVVNLILRNPGFRKTLDILVAKGTTAGDVMKHKAVKSDITSFELSKLLSSNADTLNNTKAVSVYQLHEMILSDCPSAVVPTVFLKENNSEDSVCVEGTAAFYDSKLQGFLDSGQSKLYNLITQKADNGYVSCKDPELSPKPISARVKRSSADAVPSINGEKLSLRLDIKAEVILEGSSLLNIDLLDKQSVARIENNFNSQLSGDIKELIWDIQSTHKSDIFSFYKEFEDKYRQEWQYLKEDWPSHFRDMEVEANVDITIIGSGLIGNYQPAGNGKLHENALP